MLDPIGNFERIRELYISYLDTAFRIGDDSVSEERRLLLREPGQLCTEPLVEPIPRYESSTVGFEELLNEKGPLAILNGFSEPARKAFINLVLAGLFPSRPRSTEDEDWPFDRVPLFKPYTHQVEMLRRGIKEGKPGVVTSGTGSGKTEAFLLPVLARITQEAINWPKPSEEFLGRRWWHDPKGNPYTKKNEKGENVVNYNAIPRTSREAEKQGEPNRHPSTFRPSKNDATRSPFKPHRLGEHPGRPAAVRALVLYPMNALVEDQLVRLRKSLDSREARMVMEKNLNGNRIFFGRYTGATPVTGHHLHPGLLPLLEVPAKSVESEPPVYFPDHKDADENTGLVDLTDIRDKELERRGRKLEELFKFMVDAEEGQRQARIHVIEQESLRNLIRDFSTLGEPVESRDFIRCALKAGYFSEENLTNEFAARAGREWTRDERRSLEKIVITDLIDTSDAATSNGEDAPFMFPSVDGAEQISRWDMHEHPPDILITNVSMLSAMLNREVDAPIFEKTRDWLQKDDSYFYLILDELHLQRGASGTEVAYLLRLLLHRLGLTEPNQRHKIRILSSSASLPANPEEVAKKSAEYLWDMFGMFGLSGSMSPAQAKKSWLKAIVPGIEVTGSYGTKGPPRLAKPGPLQNLLNAGINHQDGGSNLPFAKPAFILQPDDPKFAELWRDVANSLSVPISRNTDLRKLVADCIKDAANRLLWACLDSNNDKGREYKRTRATPLSEIATRLFGNTAEKWSFQDQLESVRALLFVRGAGDGLSHWLKDWEVTLPPFRVHTFFRSIEGLYAPAWSEARSRLTKTKRQVEIGTLSIERKPRLLFGTGDNVRSLRMFELVYCECCGELMIGGLKAQISRGSQYIAELLPHEPQLDGLPDKSASQRFEDLSWDQYGLFWPRTGSPVDVKSDDKDRGVWVLAALERDTGGVYRIGPRRAKTKQEVEEDDRLVLGYYYDRNQKSKDRHKRGKSSPGSNVPYGCPKCGTSYAWRSKEFRLSPIRNFRAGFGKTTQLLATELFDAQQQANPQNPAKLVSFSDSRQGAAKSALSIERNHHQELRRELLVFCLKREMAHRRPGPDIQEELNQINKQFSEALDSDLDTAGLVKKRNLLLNKKSEVSETSVALDAVLEPRSFEKVAGKNLWVHPFISEFVLKGVHPYDDAGKHRPCVKQDGKDKRFDWFELFTINDNAVRWRDDDAQQNALEKAREELVTSVHRALTEVVFSKTYFSFEEAGQGYATVAMNSLPEDRRSSSRVLELAGLIRVLADSYRYWPSPYERKNPITTFGQANRRVKDYAAASWPGKEEIELELALEDLATCGHKYGTIDVQKLRFQLTEEQTKFFRCNFCQRVHLHRGTGVCTRCFKPLAHSEEASIRDLWARNFLANRVSRVLEQAGPKLESKGSYRLHCEELTGQTEDAATRQREFKGIFVPHWNPKNNDRSSEPEDSEGRVLRAERSFQAKDEIDLLTVTTTMEVGIDIGPLQIVLQANMPPQRYNYQQRVGRAGRRGQAFSMALTICRSRSHDLYYFRHPKRMTGDIPPTPFLTKKMDDIACRFLYKEWLSNTFRRLRQLTRDEGAIFPGDLMSPPDIHGEFLPSSFLPSAKGVDWANLAENQLVNTLDDAIIFANLLTENSPLDLRNKLVPGDLRSQMEQYAADLPETGLAHTLAERGLLPMYGMPTRVRQLYLKLKKSKNLYKWSTVDRDLDLAIYEFAPGSSIVIDKEEHLAVGMTPDLAPPYPGGKRGSKKTLHSYQKKPYGQRLWMLECRHCHAWTRCLERPEVPFSENCQSCGQTLSSNHAQLCWVPNGFRTNFRPKTRQEDADSGIRHRSIQAEAKSLYFRQFDGKLNQKIKSSAAIYLDARSHTYRLNRGPEHEDREMGFNIRIGSQNLCRSKYELPAQAISTEARLEKDVKQFEASEAEECVWLASPKTTDSLFLQPTKNPTGLALHRLPSRSDASDPPYETVRWLGVRAAALSASYLIVNRASLDLDIDPEEFDVLEPRIYGSGANQLPLLQISDHLVNGAGFCRNLYTATNTGTPKILEMISSMLGDCLSASEILEMSTKDSELPYPLEFIEEDHHNSCDTACYKCLLRYGNQPYHGILDWQLGATYLRALVDPSFRCGLDGDFRFWGIEHWPMIATQAAEEMALRFTGETGSFAGVPAFRIKVGRGNLSPWVLVGHPLWDLARESSLEFESILYQAKMEASEYGDPLCWDTFNLARRQVQVREWVRRT